MHHRLSRRGGSRRLPPTAPAAALPASGSRARLAAGGGLLLAACLAVLPGRAPAALPSPPAASAAPVPADGPDALDRLERLARVQADLAVPALEAFLDALRPDDPRRLEALMELGAADVVLSRADAAEQVARRIESLGDRFPLARPAALLLRGHWLQAHGEVSKAERQLIEAAALMPTDAPPYLRLRLLLAQADVRSRGGHYDEALKRYNQALQMAEDGAVPPWRRVDLLSATAGLLMDAGQAEKGMELNAEQLRLATAAGDEFGISRAYTARAVHLSTGTDSPATLAAMRAALDHAQRSGSKRQTVLSLANMADYYLVHGDFRTAYEMSQNALPMAREIGNESAQSVALANTGLALISMKRKEEGLPLVRESMALDERAGSAKSIADTAEEVGGYLERAGYLGDALAAYHQYRQLSDELDQQDRQRSVIELQEGFANERREHELDMLRREGRLKDEEILHHDLQIKQWTAAGAASLLLLTVVAVLARRLRARNVQLSRSNEQLRLQAEIDPLTGLSNRHHLASVLAQRRTPGLEGTLYLIDVDHFKRINDRCGHAGGDTVLVEIARRLRTVVRDDDLVVRWGGEEFLVLVRPLPQHEAEALAQRLLAALADAPVWHDGRPVPVSASIGFAPFPLPPCAVGAPGSGLAVPWERAVALVDAAMYIAKSRGRNAACGVRAADAPDIEAFERIVQSLEKAAAEGQAVIHLQAGPTPRDGSAPAAAALPAQGVPA